MGDYELQSLRAELAHLRMQVKEMGAALESGDIDAATRAWIYQLAPLLLGCRE